MKKILSILALLVFGITLGACDTDDVEDPEDITLTYAAWNLGDPDSQTPNLERLMLDAFEEKYPNITIEVIERPKQPDPTNEDQQIDTPWNEFLAAQASKGELPDVFFPDNIPLSIQNGWVYDLSDIASEDEEFANVSSDITDAGRYGDKLYVIPLSAHYFGFLVNEDVFNNANADVPEFGIEWTDFIASVKAVATHQSGGEGIVGFEGVEHIMHWYPAQLNDNLGWFTYDGENLQLTDPSFKTAVELQHQLYADKSFVLEALSAEEQAEYFGEGWKWGEGRHAVKFDGSWAISGMLNDMENGNIEEYDFSFIGTPSVDGTQRIPITLDFIAVSSDTENPEEAYELAKWMGFGKEGYSKRLELSTTETGINPITAAPLQPEQELLDSFFEIYGEVDGFREVVEHGQYIVEPVKFLPGYIQARYDAQYDADDNMWSIFNKLMRNEIDFSSNITQINEVANQALDDAYQQLEDEINK